MTWIATHGGPGVPANFIRVAAAINAHPVEVGQPIDVPEHFERPATPSSFRDGAIDVISLTVSADFTGSGSLTATTIQGYTVSAGFTGAGSLSVTVTPAASTSASLTGVGNLSVTLTPAATTSAGLTALGNLSATVVPGYIRAAGLAGTGSLSVIVGVGETIFVNLSGSGALSASTTAAITLTAPLTGFGQLSVTLEKADAPLPHFTPPTYDTSIPNQGMWTRYLTQVGESIVRIGGVLTLHPYPDSVDLHPLQEGVDYFLGGYEYEVSAETAAELVEAGFSLDGTTDPPGFGEGGFGEGGFGS